MIPPTTDPADKRKADALDRWVERLKEEAMRNLPTDLEVLPSPLLLEQMEPKPSSSSRCRNRRRAGVNSRSAGEEVVTLPADVRTAASKPASSSATAKFPRVAAAPPMQSSARCSEATPEELEE
ncbi:hypothetical protein CRENBAI_011762 [Crenichthys baileyi]|uniref:Uncharacterized protein n=1 Tax=Crenichthys baileyi TaxID=28760 RepID=A0AAV9RYD5_9TELE